MNFEQYANKISKASTIKQLKALYNKIGKDEDITLGDEQDALLNCIESHIKRIEEQKRQAEKEIEERVNILKAMHLIMQNMNDEDAYMDWSVIGVPDEPSEDDFVFIAEDAERYNECFNAFARIIHAYKSAGLCTCSWLFN